MAMPKPSRMGAKKKKTRIGTAWSKGPKTAIGKAASSTPRKKMQSSGY